MKTANCSDCWEDKPLTTEYWHRNASRKSGFNNICKDCKRRRDKAEYKEKTLNEYALYKGEEILQIGTISEIAKSEGILQKSVRFLMTPTYKKRTKSKNRRTLVKLEA